MCSILDIAPINVSGSLGVKDFIKLHCMGKYRNTLLGFEI